MVKGIGCGWKRFIIILTIGMLAACQTKNNKNMNSQVLLKRAQKLKEMTDDKKPVKEADFKKLILKEYTFLKRPAAIIDGEIIVGNDKIAVAALIKALPK